jgi:hypothetical protein
MLPDSRICKVLPIHARKKEQLADRDEDWPESVYQQRAADRMQRTKDRYKRRKIKCVEYAKLCIAEMPEYLSFLENHSKQDDLSDAFLQACDWLSR